MAIWLETDSQYVDYAAEKTGLIVANFQEHPVIDISILEGWHKQLCGPVMPEAHFVGKIRRISHKDRRLNIDVTIGPYKGMPAFAVPEAMRKFCNEINAGLASLSKKLPISDSAGLRAVVALASRAHGEFIRIHPFRDGNGRLARLLVNCLLAHAGVPYVMSPKPRPGGSFDDCAAYSMLGDHTHMEIYLLRQIVLNRPGQFPAP